MRLFPLRTPEIGVDPFFSCAYDRLLSPCLSQVCASSSSMGQDGSPAEERAAEAAEGAAAPVLLAPGLKYSYEWSKGDGGNAGKGAGRGDGSEASAAAAATESAYVDVSGAQSVDDLAAQLSSLQSFQF